MKYEMFAAKKLSLLDELDILKMPKESNDEGKEEKNEDDEDDDDLSQELSGAGEGPPDSPKKRGSSLDNIASPKKSE